MRFSEAHGRKVVSTATADTVGKVDQFLVDAPKGHVVGLSLKKSSGSGDTLPWASIAAFGTDAVTVADQGAIIEADNDLKVLQDKRFHLQGKRILSQEGIELGHVTDVDFDPSDGTIRDLITDHEEVSGSRLVAVGSYAVVVSVPS